MNEGIDDRLLHAKKLLKKYQSKQNHQQQESSLHSSNGADGSNVDITPPGNFSVNGAFHGGSTSMTGSITSSRPPSVTSERPVLDELFHLRQTLREKESAHIELIAKLQELHNHYAELYNAYNSIAQSAQNSDPSVPLAEYALQISQLQTALAVAIEEKTKLQSELRELQFRLQNIGSEYKRLENSQMDVAVATGELANLREERLRLSETIFNQSQQIETHRKECSELEAKILLIQQDRNETQARLKYIYEEKRNLEEDLDRMKNELNMKEIYIRQLTRFSQNDPAQDQLVIQALTEEKRLAEEEAQARVAELNELRKQFDSSRDHYERCIVDLREQITAIQTDFRASNDAKMRLESVNTYQEEQIRLLKAALNLQKQEKDETEIVKNGALKASDAVSLEQFEAIRNAYAVMEVDFFRCRERLQDLELSLEQRDSNLESIQCELINAQRKIADLEEANRLQATINTDVNALAEQLQNQKATVSRAVEQNVELKRQLAELQDKIVAVTNESAAIEDERLSAIANVTRLQKLIDDLTIASETTTKIDLSTEREIPIAQLSNGTNEILLQKDETVQHNKLQTTIDSKTSCSTEQAKVKTEAHKALSLGKIDELQAQLEASQKREVDLQAANERLEHLLTVLEMENESIGEYVALYRFQRANLKKKLCDRDMSLERLRDERADSTIRDSVNRCIEAATQHQNLNNNSTNVAECNSRSFASSGGTMMKCSGCVECRGEMVNL